MASVGVLTVMLQAHKASGSLLFVYHHLEYGADGLVKRLRQSISRCVVSRGMISFYMILCIEIVKAAVLNG